MGSGLTETTTSTTDGDNYLEGYRIAIEGFGIAIEGVVFGSGLAIEGHGILIHRAAAAWEPSDEACRDGARVSELRRNN
jgi:hypothetical protein